MWHPEKHVMSATMSFLVCFDWGKGSLYLRVAPFQTTENGSAHPSHLLTALQLPPSGWKIAGRTMSSVIPKQNNVEILSWLGQVRGKLNQTVFMR